MRTDLSRYNNGWYKKQIGASTFKQAVWYVVNAVFFINPLNPFSSLKRFLLRLFGAHIGKGVVLKPSINVKYPWKLFIGNHSWIGERVWIDNLADIKIGNDVCISQGAMLLTGNHNYNSDTFDLIVSSILIQDGAWVGSGSMVCPGVTMFSHAVLAVNSVATKDMEAFCIYQGNPAQKVRVRNLKTNQNT